MRGHPLIRGCFLRIIFYHPHVKEPVMKGYLSCRDNFHEILRNSLKTDFAVHVLSL